MTRRCRARARSPSNPSAPAAGRPAPSLRPPIGSPAKQQQFLGQGGLAGVRMRDDRKGAPAQNLVGQGTHQSASAVLPVKCGSSVATGPAAPALAMDMMVARRFANCHRAAKGAFLARRQPTTMRGINNYCLLHLQHTLQRNFSLWLQSSARYPAHPHAVAALPTGARTRPLASV